MPKIMWNEWYGITIVGGTSMMTKYEQPQQETRRMSTGKERGVCRISGAQRQRVHVPHRVQDVPTRSREARELIMLLPDQGRRRLKPGRPWGR